MLWVVMPGLLVLWQSGEAIWPTTTFLVASCWETSTGTYLPVSMLGLWWRQRGVICEAYESITLANVPTHIFGIESVNSEFQ